MSNTSGIGVDAAIMSKNGNFILSIVNESLVGKLSTPIFCSYWSGLIFLNTTDNVITDSSSNGIVYVHKNDGDYGTLSSVTNQTFKWSSILRRNPQSTLFVKVN
ncbi:non-specific serine,threonine protein kinase [Sarracenia purpurea var. burkii]